MNKTESILQGKCYKWFHNYYPKYRGLLCYNLNNSRNAIEGARNKVMGLQKGRADMTLYANGTAYFFEFKTPDSGVQSKYQKDWQKLVESQGYKYYIIDSVELFMNTLYELKI